MHDPLRSRRPILLVDDDREIRELTARVLSRDGYVVATASDGDDAMTQLRAGLEPFVILLDLMMPGKDGFEFRREQLAHPELAAIPTLLLSGSQELFHKAGELAFACVLKKPVRFNELKQVIGSHALPA